MPTIELLKRKIESAQEFLSVVKTMKALAAASIRQYERAVESLAEYNRTIEMGLSIALRERSELTALEPTKNNRLGAIVFGSDRGMCGQFNEQICEYAIAQMNNLPIQPKDRTILAVGERVIVPLEDAVQAIAGCLSMPSSIAGITPMVQELLLQIEAWRFQQQIEQIVLFYNQPLSNTSHCPHTLYLLPIDREWLHNLKQQKWPSRVLPTFTMDWRQLFSSLLRQYLFVSLYRACAASLASENASRLASMQVAEQNIEERLTDFNAEFQNQRQTSITAEILEILSGFEVLTPADRSNT